MGGSMPGGRVPLPEHRAAVAAVLTAPGAAGRSWGRVGSGGDRARDVRRGAQRLPREARSRAHPARIGWSTPGRTACACGCRTTWRSSGPGGTLSGPTIMGLADAAAWLVTLSRIGPVALAVTSSLTISFLAKPGAGRPPRPRLAPAPRAPPVGERGAPLERGRRPRRARRPRHRHLRHPVAVDLMRWTVPRRALDLRERLGAACSLVDVELPSGARFEHHVVRHARRTPPGSWRGRRSRRLAPVAPPLHHRLLGMGGAGWSHRCRRDARRGGRRREVLEETGWAPGSLEPLTTYYAAQRHVGHHLPPASGRRGQQGGGADRHRRVRAGGVAAVGPGAGEIAAGRATTMACRSRRCSGCWPRPAA